MPVSLSQLLEDSFQIAWEYLEWTGKLGDRAYCKPVSQRHDRNHDSSRPPK
jgi:hypothetical protein